MSRDILINPHRGSTGSNVFPEIQFNGLNASPIRLIVDDDGSVVYTGASGSSLFSVRDAGNVGIGTASPTSKLHVVGEVLSTESFLPSFGIASSIRALSTSSNQSLVSVENTFNDNYARLIASTNYSQLTFKASSGSSIQMNDSSSVEQLRITTQANSWQNFFVYRNNLEFINNVTGQTLLRLDYLDRVGINISSPTAKLHVVGSDNTSGNHSLKIESASASSLLSVRNDGFVGIGLTSATSKLVIKGDNFNNSTSTFKTTDSNNNTRFEVLDAGDVTITGHLGINTPASGFYDIVTNGSGTSIYLTNGGLQLSNATATIGWGGFSQFTTDGSFGLVGKFANYYFNDYNNNNDVSIIYNSGSAKFGIGTSSPPTTKLHINATQSGTGFRLVDTSEGSGKVLTSDANGVGTWATASVASGNGVTASGTTNYVSKFTSTNVLGNSLIYDNGTNVGIGTASPTEKLSIYDGNIGFSLGKGLVHNGAYTFTTDTFNGNSLLIGRGVTGTNQAGESYIALGAIAHSTEVGIAIGNAADVRENTYDGIAIGRAAVVDGGTIRGIAIGRNANAKHNNAWAIGYNAVTTQDNEFNFGVSGTLHKYTFNGQVGIGIASSTTLLHINATYSGGGFRLVDTTQGLNKVLTSDTNGVGTWQTPGTASGIGSVNKYSTTISNGSITSNVAVTITHSLSTTDIVPVAWDVSTGELTYPKFSNRTTSTVDVTFTSVPVSDIRIVITA